MKLKLAPALLLCAIGALPLSASAQWQWIDSQGKRVFSDQPPPTDVPDKNILQRPGARAAAPANVSIIPSTSPAPAPPTGGVDKALEEKKRQTEEAEKAKQAAEAQKLAQAKADNCARARQGQATLDSGIRLAQVNAQGERVIMDDDARAAEQQRVQAIIASDCTGAGSQ
jgi:hypothetical protein